MTAVRTAARRRLAAPALLLIAGLCALAIDWSTAGVKSPGKRTGDPAPARPRPEDPPFRRQAGSGSFEARRLEYLQWVLASGAGRESGNVWTHIARLQAGAPGISGQALAEALQAVNERRDPSDFQLAALVRLYYLQTGKGRLHTEQEDAIRSALRSYKYWFDEPNRSSVEMWTENHQILCASSEYLAGQLLRSERFTNNGQSGQRHLDAARARILRWIDWHARTGFAEFDSSVYYQEDLGALFNLADFAEDPAVAIRAAMMIDLILFDIAADSWYGQHATAHGRVTSGPIKSAAGDSLMTLQALAWGLGRFQSASGMAAISLATSPKYRVPEVLKAVAGDSREELTNLERHSIPLTRAGIAPYGLRFDRLEDLPVFWGMGAFSQPEVVNLTIDAAKAWDLWDYPEFRPIRSVAGILRSAHVLPVISRVFDPDSNGALLPKVNKATFRTPDYQLSAAQDYRKGEKGYQQHIWQATLGPYAVVFTTNPGSLAADDRHRPSYWMGNARLPRVAQHRNLLIALYDLPRSASFAFTHAYFPKWAFDEIRELAGVWVFGRAGDGYVGIYSREPYVWTTEGPDAGQEMVASGRHNVWLCVLGRKAADSSFDEFIRKVTAGAVGGKHLRVDYAAPGLGRIGFDWTAPLTVDGKEIPLRGYPRWKNPYADAEFGTRVFDIRAGGKSLHLDFTNATRRVSE